VGNLLCINAGLAVYPFLNPRQEGITASCLSDTARRMPPSQ